MEWHKGDAVPPGAMFKGTNSHGHQVVDDDLHRHRRRSGQGVRIRRHERRDPVAHWRYDIVAGDGACRVTERTWDRRPGWFRMPAGWATGVKDRNAANAEHIAHALQRLKEKAERT